MSASELPSFSIVLETENLANIDPEELVRSLSSLAAQDPAPTAANEVLLIDSGDIPADLLTGLTQQYPWIKICSAPAETGYYESKMLGAELATGDVVVYYDSDCVYEAGWLRKMLMPFVHEAIEIVAGETTTHSVGIYGTAMALTYIFPQYSDRTELTPGQHYFLNNVAFRRSRLLDRPIPTGLPLYRGNCVIHAHDLVKSGMMIWQQPQARALHAPPSGLSHFCWRFLLIGHDYYWQKQLIPIAPSGQGKLEIFSDRIRKMVRHDRRHLVFLPFALPIVIVASLLIYIGYLITTHRPNCLTSIYNKTIKN